MRTRSLLRLLLLFVFAAACNGALGSCGAQRAADVPLARVLVLPESYAHSIAALGFPGMSRAFQVGHGSQLGAGDGAFEWQLDTRDSVATSPVYFEADGVPVAHWWMVSAADSAHFEAAAYQVSGEAETLLIASVRATVTTRAGAPSRTALRLIARDELTGPHFRPWDAARKSDLAWSWNDGRMACADRVRGALASASQWRVAGAGSGEGARLEATSQPGATVLECWFPDRPVTLAQAARITTQLHHDQHASRTRAAWREWLGRGATFSTSDTLVNQAYRAALVTLLQGQERSAGEWVPIGNPLQYRDVWLRDGARVIRALALAGFSDLARSDALTFMRYQLPSGAMLSQAGQLDGAGQALWAFEQAAGCPPDAAWSKRYLPVAVRAGQWLRNQRILSSMVARGIRVDWPGLLPFGDPRDAELVRAPLVGNDAWAIAGQFSLAAMAARAGDAAASDAALAEGEAHRTTFMAALARSPHSDVPPSWPGDGRDWGNCAVGFPTRVLPPEDPRLAALAQRAWAFSGLHMMAYGSPDSLHTYLGTDLGVWALLAGRPADARDVLREVLAHSSSTLGQAELFSRSSRRFGGNLPPHGTAAAQLVELIRDMVVLDARDTLEIAAGGDSVWWHGTRLLKMPTRFGLVDVSLAQPAPGMLVARWSAVPVPVRVRVPDGLRLESVEGARMPAPSSRWVECRSGQTSVVLRVTPS